MSLEQGVCQCVSDTFCWSAKLELKSDVELIASDLVLVNNVVFVFAQM